MKELELLITKETREVKANRDFLATQCENHYQKARITFTDGFIDGFARLQWENKGQVYSVELTKDGESYLFDPSLSELIHAGYKWYQIVIDYSGRTFRTQKFWLKIYDDISAATDVYPLDANWRSWTIEYVEQFLLDNMATDEEVIEIVTGKVY